MTTTLFLLLFFDVRGVVLDPAARPVQGAEVACGSETVSTNARGEFSLAKSTDCDATIRKPGFAQRSVRLASSSATQVTLTLEPHSDRVLVSAAGAPVAVEEAGVAATVFTARDFEARQFPFVQDVLREVPGLNVVQTGSTGGIVSVFARGSNSNNATVLLDGVPVNEPGGSLDFVHLTSLGIDRMEVIRGPESALIGPEAPGAVIQLFTRAGDLEARVPHGSVSYERGSFSTDHWNASLSGGLANRIDYSLTGDQFRTTGEFPNNAYRVTTGSANLGYHFSDRTTLRAIFREYDSFTGDPNQDYYGIIDHDAHNTDRDSSLSVRLDDTRGSRYTQHVSFGYHRHADAFDDGIADGPYNIAALIRTIPGVHPFVYLVRQVPYLTATADPGTTLVKLTTKLSPFPSTAFTDRTSTAYQGTFAHRGGSLSFGYEFERQAGVISRVDVDRHNNGFFVSEQYALTSRIFLVAAARLEQSSVFGTKFAPRAAVTFRVAPGTFFRLSASRGIQEPSLLQSFAHESFYVGNPSLRPEKTTSYEAGLSRHWFGRRLETGAAAFRNTFRDLINFDFSNFPGTFINIDRSWARGVEIYATARPAPYVTLRAAYTRLYTRIVNASSKSSIGTELLRRPRNSGSITLEATPKRWTLVAGARMVGESQDGDFVFGVNRNPGYEFVYVDGAFQATRHVSPFVRIANALDEHYQEALGFAALSRNAAGGVRLTW
jgi:outer membrane cobalamin receptor